MPANFAARELYLLYRSRYWFLPLLEPTQLCTNVASLLQILLLASLVFLPQSSLRLYLVTGVY